MRRRYDEIHCLIHDLLKKQHELATIFKQSRGLRPRVHLTHAQSNNDDPIMTSIFTEKSDKQVISILLDTEEKIIKILFFNTRDNKVRSIHNDTKVRSIHNDMNKRHIYFNFIGV